MPVTLYHSGTTIMYRLFEDLTDDKLVIFQGMKLNVKNQLPNLKYTYYQPLAINLKTTRFKEVYLLLNIFRNYFFVPRQLSKLFSETKPNVIVTVSYNLLWILAYRFAKRKKIPFVLLVHDDIDAHISKDFFANKLLNYLFGFIYKNANARFSISPLMNKVYSDKYQIQGDVLFPLQPKVFIPPADEESSNKKYLTYAYAGTLDTGVYVDMLIRLSRLLESISGNIFVYSNSFPDTLSQQKNIIYKGFVSPDELLNRLNIEADVLFVPFSFHNKNIDLAFPSKIVDYSMIKKPLFIWAPLTSAVAIWYQSLDYPVGILLTETENDNSLSESINNLCNYENRRIWGANSYIAGKAFFENSKQKSIFYNKIENCLKS